ncbi:MAG TPA: hypothetical protein VJK51_05000 [Candidatus Nanoarchaeia archaeon]|nr:hypothetical protein [Candidatus Nanoarchaeia archaeon]
MEMETHEMSKNLLRMRRDIELIKNILMSEGELSDYAREELAKARKENKEDYVDLDEL